MGAKGWVRKAVSEVAQSRHLGAIETFAGHQREAVGGGQKAESDSRHVLDEVVKRAVRPVVHACPPLVVKDHGRQGLSMVRVDVHFEEVHVGLRQWAGAHVGTSRASGWEARESW